MNENRERNKCIAKRENKRERNSGLNTINLDLYAFCMLAVSRVSPLQSVSTRLLCVCVCLAKSRINEFGTRRFFFTLLFSSHCVASNEFVLNAHGPGPQFRSDQSIHLHFDFLFVDAPMISVLRFQTHGRAGDKLMQQKYCVCHGYTFIYTLWTHMDDGRSRCDSCATEQRCKYD